MNPLVRKPDWEPALNAFIAERHATVTHEWGGEGPEAEDCAAFAAGAVRAQTGVDLYKAFRGKYDSKTSADAMVAKTGNPNLAGLLETMLPRIHKAMAQRGDIVLTSEGNLAVVYGAVALGIKSGEGLIRIDRAHWRKAWKVGTLDG